MAKKIFIISLALLILGIIFLGFFVLTTNKTSTETIKPSAIVTPTQTVVAPIQIIKGGTGGGGGGPAAK